MREFVSDPVREIWGSVFLRNLNSGLRLWIACVIGKRRSAVRSIEGQVEKPRLRLVRADESQRLAAEQVSGVPAFVFLCAVISAEHRRDAIAFVRVIVDAVVAVT